jgi:hypothetical protein
MCLEDAGARHGSGLGEAAAEAFGLEGTVGGEADDAMRGMAFGCSGCAAVGHCRLDLDQELLASACMERSAQTEAW